MRLTLYPAIDLKGGACVRLRQGDMRDVTVFSDDPAGQAGAFAAAGARWLHIVDLDGAFAGETVNRRAIAGILASVAIPVQLGGGLRDMTAIRFWLDAGVRRVVLGSAAIKDPVLVRNAAREYPGRIAVGVDARDGFVAAEGWAETSHLSAFELARRFEGAGVAALIFTDIARDGMLAGAAIDATLELAETVSIPVIASGGIGGAEDLRALRDAAMAGGRRRLEGVIVGRALYDGRLDCAEALRILAGTEGANGRVAGPS